MIAEHLYKLTVGTNSWLLDICIN